MRGYLYWLAGQSTSGAALDWLRGILAEPPLAFGEFQQSLNELPDEPTGITFYPYLSGSGSPHTNALARGAFIGLNISHRRAHLAKAILEGTAYEMDFARRSAETVAGHKIDRLVAAGGGSRINKWMQIRADVSGCQIDVHPVRETTLLGAALLAGIGSGVYASQAELASHLSFPPVESFYPDLENHKVYKQVFENAFLKYQEPLRDYHRSA
jgi:xylulokinase